MAFVADYNKDFTMWDYIHGDASEGMSIMVSRWFYLLHFSNEQGDGFKVAFRDPVTEAWTKWLPFPGVMGILMRCDKRDHRGFKVQTAGLEPAVDVHRSVLPYEIVIESDYPTYEENWKASRIIGAILEKKGFSPLYYYSGNKSIHIHVFFDWTCFRKVERLLADQVKQRYKGNRLRFRAEFMEWLRSKMISCWDTEARKFDPGLIKASHLIRCEMSKNKQGYKTFLGYHHKDMSPIPYICNESNRIYPRLGKLVFSSPSNPQELIEEFMVSLDMKVREMRNLRLNRTLGEWVDQGPEHLRPCVKAIMNDEFKAAGDGMARGMFILVNELKRIFGDKQAHIIVDDWNERMGSQILQKDIDYRFRSKNFTLTCDYVHSFLAELGIDVSEKCKGKVYKHR